MSYKDITEGKYTAKIVGGRMIQNKDKTKTAIEIAFDLQAGDSIERLLWQGWLSEAAIERTMKTLVEVLGYNGSTALDEDGHLTDPAVFDFSRQVTLVVEMEEYQTQTGEMRQSPKIKWINAIAKSAFAGLRPETVKSTLAATGFQAAFLAAKKVVVTSAPPLFDTEEKLGF